MNPTAWETILADRSLQDLPYKIETNRYGKIIMSPHRTGTANSKLKSHGNSGT